MRRKLCLKLDINPKTFSERLDHANTTSVTMNIYIHIFRVNKKASACVFDNLQSTIVNGKKKIWPHFMATFMKSKYQLLDICLI